MTPRFPLTRLSAPLPLARAAPTLAAYSDLLVGALRIGDAWHVVFDGEVRTTAHRTRVAAIEELTSLARAAKFL